MRLSEIVGRTPAKPVQPTNPTTGSVAPLTPAQATRRAKKVNAAQAKLADTRAQAAIKIAAAQRKAIEI